MLHDLTVSTSIEINAPIEHVWKTMTDPELIKLYLFGTETITDWKVGSNIIFQGEYNGTSYKDKGIVKENIAREKLSYRYWSAFTGLEDVPENYSLVTYLLEKLNDEKTQLTWEQTGFANNEGYQHSKNGMGDFMKKIKEVAENNMQK